MPWHCTLLCIVPTYRKIHRHNTQKQHHKLFKNTRIFSRSHGNTTMYLKKEKWRNAKIGLFYTQNTQNLNNGITCGAQVWAAKKWSSLMINLWGNDKCLVLSTTQRFSVYCQKGVKILIIPSWPFFRKLDGFSQQGNLTSVSLPMEMVTCSLQDLINYFQPPPEGLDHEAKQNNMTALKNRQHMFQEEVNKSLCVNY